MLVEHFRLLTTKMFQFLMIVMTIIKLNDPVRDHSVFWRGCSEHEIPKDSTKPETPVGIFAMMMDMKLVKMGKNFS